MSKESIFGQSNLRFLYYRYKDSPYYSLSIVTLVISVCIILLFQVVIPQFQSWLSIRDEAERTRGRVEVINQNINFMSNLDKSQLNKQLEVATAALPTEKDFGSILNALSDSAVRSGVSFDDYTFQIGNIASVSGQLSGGAQKDLASVKLTIALTGTVDGINAFLKEIAEKLPLSEVSVVDSDIRSTTVTLQFYQKQFPRITFKDDQPIVPLSSANVALIEKLSAWKPIGIQDAVATSSAPLF